MTAQSLQPESLPSQPLTSDNAPSQTEPLIVAQNVSHQYQRGKMVVDKINFELGTGLYGLLGANGAGKSTLMRILCTLTEPVQGDVYINGFHTVKQRGDARRVIGYLPQEFGAWKNQRVARVLDVLLALSGERSKAERNGRIEAVLSKVGLAQVAGRKVGQLSGGMLRRLGVAQALIHNPPVIVMDEPTTGLDPEERIRFRQLMVNLSQAHCVLLSTHIIADLGATCSQLLLIHQGEMQFFDTPSRLIEQAAGSVVQVTEAQLAAESEKGRFPFHVVNSSRVDGRVMLRGVTHRERSFDAATHVNDITLEEAYLAFAVNQGHDVSVS